MIKILRILGIIILLWISITNIIQSFKCDSMTSTQLFKRLPQSFVLNFKTCN